MVKQQIEKSDLGGELGDFLASTLQRFAILGGFHLFIFGVSVFELEAEVAAETLFQLRAVMDARSVTSVI